MSLGSAGASVGSAEMNDAAAEANGHRRGSVLHFQFLKNVLDVAVRRFLGNAEPGADLLVAHSVREKIQHIDLALRER